MRMAIELISIYKVSCKRQYLYTRRYANINIYIQEGSNALFTFLVPRVKGIPQVHPRLIFKHIGLYTVKLSISPIIYHFIYIQATPHR